MKTSGVGVALLALAATGAYGQTAANTAGEATSPPQARETPFSIVERGPHQRVWRKVTREVDKLGRTVLHTNVAYVELATGLHFKNSETGQWEESREEFELLPGKAVAKRGQHKATLNFNLNSAGAIEMETPDGKKLKSHVLGLSYFDTASGQSVLIAEVKDCVGKVVGNRVIYEDAFTDFKADVRYTYSKAGFEQDIILREQPPKPEDYGLNPETTRLQVLTEFVQAPQPVRETASVRRAAGASMPDETLRFGDVMRIERGRAFLLDGSGKDIPVAKQWLKLEGRDVLVEEAAVPSLNVELKKLPKATSAKVQPAPDSARHVVSTKRMLPEVKVAKTSDKPMELARASLSGKGLVLDYVELNWDTNDFTFQGDTTYFVSGGVNLSGTTTFEGGTVIKFSDQLDGETFYYDPETGSGAGALSCAAVNCQTGPYRPAVFTSMHDNSVGEIIPNSSGQPSTLAVTFLQVGPAPYCPDTMLNYLRFSYANVGLLQYALGNGLWLRHCQFVNCGIGIAGYGNALNLGNCLLAGGVGVSLCEFGDILTLQNVTMDNESYNVWLADFGNIPEWIEWRSTLNVTNSLFAGGQSLSDAGTQLVNVGGSFNAEANADVSGSAFQQVGGGYYYLATNSPYRNAATTNIDPALLAELKTRTTHPPVVLTNRFTAGTNLSAVAPRDTDVPDLGYHYDPIDWWTSCSVSNATLSLTGGAVIGYYQAPGIWLDSGSKLVSLGTPLSKNRIVYFGLAQEQPVVFDPNGLSQTLPINPWHTDLSRHPEVSLRFTTLNIPQGSDYLLNCGTSDWELQRLEFRDCEIYGGGAYFQFSGAASGATYRFQNNLIQDTCFWIGTSADGSSTLVARNNLFRSAPWGVGIANWDAGIWQIADNVFDGVELSIDGDTGHNAYVNGATVYSTVQPTDMVVTNFNWVPGPLGDYYQPTNSPLINTGSVTNAGSAGLYHHTTTTNQVKEANSVVDIGYHYIALNPQLLGAPEPGEGGSTINLVDTDGDGTPDYLEDANGNGLVDASETDWGVDTDGDGVMDQIEILQGRNPYVAGAVPDTNDQINFEVFTPLQ